MMLAGRPGQGSTYQSGELLTGLGSKISQLAARCLRQLIHSDIVLQEREEEKHDDSIFQNNLPHLGVHLEELNKSLEGRHLS